MNYQEFLDLTVPFDAWPISDLNEIMKSLNISRNEFLKIFGDCHEIQVAVWGYAPYCEVVGALVDNRFLSPTDDSVRNGHKLCLVEMTPEDFIASMW